MAFSVRKDKVGWEAAPAAQFDTGASSDQQDSGAYRSKRFVLREDMPDGLGQLACPHEERTVCSGRPRYPAGRLTTPYRIGPPAQPPIQPVSYTHLTLPTILRV